VIRRIGQALVFVLAFLIIVGEVQRSEEEADERNPYDRYGAQRK